MSKPLLPSLVGATCSGKTTVAVAVARRIGLEIVSADSRQVYRRLDIGTAKPTAEERAAAPHHLLESQFLRAPAFQSREPWKCNLQRTARPKLERRVNSNVTQCACRPYHFHLLEFFFPKGIILFLKLWLVKCPLFLMNRASVNANKASTN